MEQPHGVYPAFPGPSGGANRRAPGPEATARAAPAPAAGAGGGPPKTPPEAPRPRPAGGLPDASRGQPQQAVVGGTRQGIEDGVEDGVPDAADAGIDRPVERPGPNGQGVGPEPPEPHRPGASDQAGSRTGSARSAAACSGSPPQAGQKAWKLHQSHSRLRLG